MPPKLSKFSGVKRSEKSNILSSYMLARQRTKVKKDALQAVAEEYGCTVARVRSLVHRYNPEKEQHLRLHGACTLTFEQEARAVGVIRGMASVGRPVDAKAFLAIMHTRHQAEKLSFGRKWLAGFLSRWSQHVGQSCGLLLPLSDRQRPDLPEPATDVIAAIIATYKPEARDPPA